MALMECPSATATSTFAHSTPAFFCMHHQIQFVSDMVIEMRIRADGIGPRASPPLHYGINRASFKWVLRIAHHLATIVGRETRFS